MAELNISAASAGITLEIYTYLKKYMYICVCTEIYTDRYWTYILTTEW